VGRGGLLDGRGGGKGWVEWREKGVRGELVREIGGSDGWCKGG